MKFLRQRPTPSDDKRWQVLSSEYLFRRPWLVARRDHVRLPNGNENPEYYVLEYPDWVNVIAITERDEFVLIRQYRHALRETRLELCAGVIEEGEDPLDAARRELLEETGFGGGTWEKILTLAPNSSTMTNYSHCYLATGVTLLSDHQTLDATEDIDVYLLSRAEVFDLLQEGEFHQALMAAPLWKYFATHPR